MTKQPIKPQLAADIAENQLIKYPQGYVRQARLDVDDLFEPDEYADVDGEY